MSGENVEILRLFYEAEPNSDDALQYLDPAVELYPGIRTPDQDARYVGHDGWKEFMVDAVGLWERVDIEPSERLEATGNRILAIDKWLFRGRDGIEIEREGLGRQAELQIRRAVEVGSDVRQVLSEVPERKWHGRDSPAAQESA